MHNNNLLDFIISIEIKHKDIPHILILLAIIFGASLTGWVFFGLTGLITAAILFISYIFISLQYNLYRANQTYLMYQQQKMQDYLTLFAAIDFRDPLPYMTGWAATPELARVVFETINQQKPSLVVELGSGISTIIASYALEQNKKGALISLDHNASYLEQTTKLLRNHRLNSFAKMMHCPLKKQSHKNGSSIWYDLSHVSFNEPIDLLLVDGPPTEIQDDARYPALPFLAPFLNDSAIIIIHDSKRVAGKRTVEAWLKEYPEFSSRFIDSEKGIAILSR